MKKSRSTHAKERKSIVPALAWIPLAGLLGALAAACDSPAVVAGAATAAGTVAAQERSVGETVTDTVIELDISRRLIAEGPGLFLDVDVDAHEGRVLLTGDVVKPQDRIRALTLAWRAPGVREVINEIQVTDKSGFTDYARDVWISTRLGTRLVFDKHVMSINYNVETVNGVVYLIGIAQDQTELDRVIHHARHLTYVRRVVNYVRLKQEPLKEVTR